MIITIHYLRGNKKHTIIQISQGRECGCPEEIVPEMVTNTFNEISEIVLTLFSRMLDIGWYPQTWACNILCPIYKSGSNTDPNNFKGISLIDILKNCNTHA